MSALLDQDLQSLQEVRSLIARAKAAQLKLKEFSQEHIDRIVAAMDVHPQLPELLEAYA